MYGIGCGSQEEAPWKRGLYLNSIDLSPWLAYLMYLMSLIYNKKTLNKDISQRTSKPNNILIMFFVVAMCLNWKK